MLKILKRILSCKRKNPNNRVLPSCDKVECLNASKLFERIESAMIDKQLFLNPKVSLSSMAMEVGTNRTYLSQTIRFRNMSFRNYINVFRIKYLLEILSSSMHSEKIDGEDLALACGFASKRAMNASLRKILGIRYCEIEGRDSSEIEKLTTFVTQKYNYGRRESNIFNEWGGEGSPSQ